MNIKSNSYKQNEHIYSLKKTVFLYIATQIPEDEIENLKKVIENY